MSQLFTINGTKYTFSRIKDYSINLLGLITGNIKLLKAVPWNRVINIPLDVEYVIAANAFPKAGLIVTVLSSSNLVNSSMLST